MDEIMMPCQCQTCAHTDEMEMWIELANLMTCFSGVKQWMLYCCCEDPLLEVADTPMYLQPFTQCQKAVNLTLYFAAVAFMLAVPMMALLM